MRTTIISILSILLIAIGCIQFAHAISTVSIFPTDDAYVVANYDDPTDRQGLEHLNTGHLPFLKAWYAWDVTKTGQEKIISIVYLKFNLTSISGPIGSASLILHPFSVNLTASMRPLDVYTGLNNNWNESEIAFIGAPAFSTDDNSTAYISNSDTNKSITWDLTRQVRSHEGSFLTLAMVIRNSYIHKEELVDFYSKEASNPVLKPQLVVMSIRPDAIQTINPTPNGIVNSVDMYILAGIVTAAIAVSVVMARKSRRNENQRLGNGQI